MSLTIIVWSEYCTSMAYQLQLHQLACKHWHYPWLNSMLKFIVWLFTFVRSWGEVCASTSERNRDIRCAFLSPLLSSIIIFHRIVFMALRSHRAVSGTACISPYYAIHVFFIGNYFGFNVLKSRFKLFNNCCVHFDTFYALSRSVSFSHLKWFYLYANTIRFTNSFFTFGVFKCSRWTGETESVRRHVHNYAS